MPSSIHAQPAWHSATVVRCENLASDIRLFDLKPEAPLAAYSPGGHLDIQVPIRTTTEIRSYSLLENAGQEGVYRIAVKRVPNSRGGSEFMWSLKAGDSVTIAPPANFFPLSFACPEYLLIAGGIGITAIHGMALALAQANKPFRLLYTARTAEQLVFAESLRPILGERLEAISNDTGMMLDIASEIAKLGPEGELYMCGPLSLMDAVRDEWQRQGRPVWSLRYETFANGGRLASTPFSVSVRNLGVEFDVPANQSLLEAMREHGVEALYDCERGECGLCAVDVLDAEGDVDHRDVYLSEQQKSKGRQMCACVSRIHASEKPGRVVIDTSRQGIA
ncbi:PDR/VanB family oxidoreductase [Phytohalomonas tamaricis]|uniref:PDR/VanB family oxidoreductase n=1 Tax=Phytohalomonas tamaricis TaxID=2081032 RepID=UPI000D0B828A|nr:PDR/VanB family oxidoreductase [Phytohalomonas tamaricis]